LPVARWESLPQLWAPPLVLAAAFPDEDDEVPFEHLIEIEEALLSFTRAALAQGRRLVVPGDEAVAPLVAQTVAEYAPPARTEQREGEAPLVEVLLTRGPDPPLEEALAGIDRVRPRVARGQEGAGEGRRHPLTVEAVRELEPAGAVVIGGSRESVEDVAVLREVSVPLFVVGPTLTGPLYEFSDLWERDFTRGTLAEIEWQEAERELAFDTAIPYAYVMQRLVEELGELAGR
jgi:hypothetical protein